MCGYQDDRQRCRPSNPVELHSYLEATLPAEIDVDQRHVRPQFLAQPQSFGACRGHANNRHALTLQQVAGGVDESGAVIDDQTAHWESRNHMSPASSCSEQVRIPTNCKHFTSGHKLQL